ncbi:MAG: SpoIIE family protein phosphatase [Sphingobacteriaceae bacterium]|nr:SpoIIE family protein phosphatase [Sphingobacteriaceae bacterium]
MGKYLCKLACALFLFLTFYVNAQTYPFSNLTINNGLSNEQVLSIFQSDDGVIWFGTSGGGITRFDGKSSEYLTVKDGLADNVVFSIAKDKKGRILIGTNNGLSVFDPFSHAKSKSARFKNYTTKEGLSHNRIFSIMFDENGVALLGTSRGISTFKDSICGKLHVDAKLDTSSIFRVMKDSQRNLWCSSLGAGVFKNDGNITLNYTTKDGLSNDMVFSVMEVGHNTIWICSGEGLFELVDGKFDLINPANLDTTITYYNCFKDRNNALWLGTSHGLIKQKKDGTYTLFKKQNGLVDNSIWDIFQDRESNMWFASDQGGVSKLASERFYIYTTKDSLLADEIQAVDQNSGNGEYWLGTKRGLTKLKNGKTKNYINKQLAADVSEIWEITHDGKDLFYMGTANGLIVTGGEKFNRYNCKDKEDRMNSVVNILVDSKGDILLGTQVGVAQLKDGVIEPRRDIGIPKTYVSKIVQDQKGNYWFCTDDGLFFYNGKTVKHYTEKDGLPACRVKNIIFDENDNIWLATSVGALVTKNGKFVNITSKLALTSPDVYSIVKDHNHHIWAGVSGGVVKINIEGDHKLRYYDGDYGFAGQVCNQNCMIIDKNDRICVGCSKGFVIYQQEYDSDNTLEPITKIKHIDLFYRETDWDQYADSVSAGDIPYNLELPYDKNYLTFNFIGVSLTAPEKVSYKFMLKGFDTEWHYSDETDASYPNIAPGKYEFILYACNGEDVWNREPVIFKFEIAPPFWRTWWFYGLIAAIILTGIYSYVKIRAANFQILKQNEIIEEKNETLQHLNLEIAEKNQNITDSINYARRIQRSFITSEKVISKLLKEHFILFKPRDIVSGDFYMAFEMHDRTLVVCADCTGHGIPGAFMSLVGISILNEISRSRTYIDTTEILEEIRRIIIEALNPDKLETGGKDGMDVSLISIFKKPENDMIKIHFSGANNSACLVSAKDGKVKMYEYKGDKQPVGYYSSMKPFTHHEIMAQKGDIMYLFTDGYADQFGGSRGKKFMSSQLKQHLVSMFELPLHEQKEKLDKLFMSWQGDLEQIDDVTVIGIKL